MLNSGIVGIILIIANILFSYFGFRNDRFYYGYCLWVDKVLVKKEYVRVFTSGFLHTGWLHLIINMITLSCFSGVVESSCGIGPLLLIYFVGLLGGNLLAVYLHRHHGDYKAVGASGAISAVVFAFIVLFPGAGIQLFGIPVNIPGWLYGLAYILYSIYGIKRNRGNIGHEAHLGGAVTGVLVSVLLYPVLLQTNLAGVLLITLPAVLFIVLAVFRPGTMVVNRSLFNDGEDYNLTIDQRYNIDKNNQKKEIDRILDKINRTGMSSLTRQEKEDLEEYSRHQ